MRILYPYKNALWALRPAKPLGVLSRHPCRNPKPLPRGEGLCMLCWLCIVQSLWAYTPGIRAGAECGCHPHPAWGYAQSKDALVACQKFCTMQNQQSKQRQTPIFKSYVGFSTSCGRHSLSLFHCSFHIMYKNLPKGRTI